MLISKIDINPLWFGEAYWLRWMGVVALVSVCGVFGRWGAEGAVAFSLGAMVGVLTFHWLHKGIVMVLNNPSTPPPKRLGVRALLRYPLILGLVILVFSTELLPIMGVISGLFVPAVGILVASLGQIFVDLGRR